MAKAAYIGIPTAFPVYKEETKTIAITAANVAQYFTVTNGSYYFAGSGSVFTSNNGGVNSSEATTTLTAKVDISSLDFRYSYSSEQKYDKFTLTVGGTTVESAVSGATTTKSYSGSLKAGQSIVLTYTKDSSQSSNDDKCTISNISITIKVKTQTGTETKVVARKVKRQHMGVNGVARKVKRGLVGVNGVARQFFAAVPTWKKYKTNVAYTLGCDATVNEVADTCKAGFHISKVYGFWPYFQCIVSGKGNPANFVSLNQSTGKVKWTNNGAFRAWSESSGGWSPSVREQGSDSDQDYNSVVFFHTMGHSGKKYDVDYYSVYATYMHDESTEKTCYISLAWACSSPDDEQNELWATVLYYTSPKLTLYHFYPKASYSRGDYIGEVTSESEGAYPANGRHTDGYWYVRQ